ncbi:MAG: heavy metal translocating P-type ATPase metal-binding domain-containing protein, partial [Betaproteobacteria bacterium]
MATDRTLRMAKVAAPADVAEQAGSCAHCGDPLAGVKVVERRLGGQRRAYCCQGCSFIAEQLYLAQAGDRDRRALDAALPEVRSAPGGPVQWSQCQVDVNGLVCAACGLLIEHRLRRLPGVAQAHVDFAAGRAYVAYDDARVTA